MAEVLILYDLPSKGRNYCWSLNPWKVRLALNYKGIPYETQWVEYPDIGPVLKATGLDRNENDPAYTIPAVRMPDRTMIMDSSKIAPALELLKAEPSLHLDSPLVQRVKDILNTIHGPLVAIWMPRVPERILNPRSKEHFDRTREERMGMPLPELAKSEQALKGWEEARPGLKALEALLRENKGGPFLMGETPSWADFILVGWLAFLKRCGDDMYDGIVGTDAALSEMYHACGKWLERDDH